jgi:hypothetical protein
MKDQPDGIALALPLRLRFSFIFRSRRGSA